jgi:hypothetical protein
MNHLTIAQRIARLYVTTTQHDVLTKIAIDDNKTAASGRLPFIAREWHITPKIYEIDKKRPIIKEYDVSALPVYHQRTKIYGDIIITTAARAKLPASIDVLKLSKMFSNNPLIFTPDIEEASDILATARAFEWMTEFKTAIIKRELIQAAQIIRGALNPNHVNKSGRIFDVAWRFNDLRTLKDVFIACKVCPRIHEETLNKLINMLNNACIEGYSVKAITEPAQITKLYARSQHVDDFVSCMRFFYTPARIYQPIFEGGAHDLILFAVYFHGEYVGRYVSNVIKNKSPTLYTSRNNNILQEILRDITGVEFDASAYDNARVPLLTDESDNVFMPYVDGDKSIVSLVEEEDDKPRYLIFNDSNTIGSGKSQTGFLNTNFHAFEKYGLNNCPRYKDKNQDLQNEEEHEEREEFLCDCCHEWISQDEHNIAGADEHNVCDYCLRTHYTSCDDCEVETHNEQIENIDVYIISREKTRDRAICACCIDSYIQLPDGIYWNREELKEYIEEN